MATLRELLVSKLLRENSKVDMLRVQEWVEQDEERLSVLFALLDEKEPRVKQRAAWVIGNLEAPQVEGYWEKLLVAAGEKNAPDGIKRNTLRLLQNFLPEEELLGKAWDLAFYM